MSITQIRKLNPEFTERVIDGIYALRSGRRPEARRLLGRAVLDDPANATAWFWLSRSVDDERERRDCLAQVRRLDQVRSTRRGKAGGIEAARAKSPRRRGVLYTLAVAVIILACVITPFMNRQPARAQTTPGSAAGRPLEASGVIQAEEVRVASEYGGTIRKTHHSKGQAVSAGETLALLDTSLLDARVEVAEAAVAMAQAGLVQLQAGVRAGRIEAAEAQLVQAQAARVAAMQAVSDTMALVQNPQDIQLQIAVMEERIRSSQLEVERALALKDAAEIGKDRFEEAQEAIKEAGGPGRHVVRIPGVPGGTYEYVVPSLPLEMHLAPNRWWQAWVGVNAAAARKEGMAASLESLYARKANPQDLEARRDEALAALARTEAQVAGAQAQVDGLRAGATPEQVAALEARVAQSEAMLDSLLAQRAAMEVVSPVAGVVVATPAHEGEVIAPGATIVTIADVSQVQLTVYLAETWLGQIALGETVRMRVDSFPGRVFVGTVTHIADRAEFTPRNVATQEERANLVSAVEISVPNEDGALKPGMPADAVFGE